MVTHRDFNVEIDNFSKFLINAEICCQFTKMTQNVPSQDKTGQLTTPPRAGQCSSFANHFP